MPTYKVKSAIIQDGKTLEVGSKIAMTEVESRLLVRRGYLEKELKATKKTKELKDEKQTK